MDTTIEDYKLRFQQLYTWKGYAQKEIDTLLAQRLEDEFALITKNKTTADLTINFAS